MGKCDKNILTKVNQEKWTGVILTLMKKKDLLFLVEVENNHIIAYSKKYEYLHYNSLDLMKLVNTEEYKQYIELIPANIGKLILVLPEEIERLSLDTFNESNDFYILSFGHGKTEDQDQDTAYISVIKEKELPGILKKIEEVSPEIALKFSLKLIEE